MDFRTTYGTLLKTQIEMYARIFDILDKIEKYDTPAATNSNSLNVCTVSSLNAIRIERLVTQLDEINLLARQSMERIESMTMLCQQFLDSPVYIQLLELQIMAEARMRDIMEK